jgi:hypothetical protein
MAGLVSPVAQRFEAGRHAGIAGMLPSPVGRSPVERAAMAASGDGRARISIQMSPSHAGSRAGVSHPFGSNPFHSRNDNVDASCP